ncbi:uncharacterized protein G2W53_009983 [Senna tora]|uniref:Uncharacterized protein n=1 Tax=Senna tora TaxID=362788 RepID=A0A835C922_9FABA|nr:uncharacterized protein G2W53_009983 [Senna tora]
MAIAPAYPSTSSYHGIEMVLCDSEPDYGSIHHFGFNFVAADRIKSGELDQNILVDVILIGRVFNMFQVHPSSPNDPKTKRVTVDIDDSALGAFATFNSGENVTDAISATNGRYGDEIASYDDKTNSKKYELL